MSCDLVIIGNISQDIASYGEIRTKPFWGGAGLNICLSATRTGRRPKLISVVGEDGSELLAQLEERIDTSLVKVLKGETSRFVMQYSEDGTLQSIDCYFGVARHLNLHFQSLELPYAHYHVCCRRPVSPKHILQRITPSGFPFSLDFILTSAAQEITQVVKWIQNVKYVFVNRQEFEILKNLTDIRKIDKLVITYGKGPVRVLEFGQEVLCQPCPVVEEFSDVTGAGDVFIGVFLASQLEGDSLHDSINQAICTAQKSIGSSGILSIF